MLFTSGLAPVRKTFPALGCCFACFALSVLTLQGGASAAEPSFTPIGDFPGGGFSSSANAVSPNGSEVVGSSSITTSAYEALRWTRAGGAVGLGYLPGGDFSSANSISGDGSVVVGEGNVAPRSSLRQAFRWTATSGMLGLGYLPGIGRSSVAYEVSPNGNTVVGYSSSSAGSQAFRWTESAGMVGLGILPGYASSDARGVSDDGDVVVGTSTASGQSRGFRWTPSAGMTPLAPLPGDAQSVASRVSADGRVTVGWSQAGIGEYHAVRWLEDGIAQSLGPVVGASGDVPGIAQKAISISADGSTIVGGASTGTFIWDEAHGARDLKTILTRDHGLDLTGWFLILPEDVSADGGTIVGFGRNPSYEAEGFVAAIPVPEPGAVAALGAGSAALLLRRRRRGHLR